MTRFGDLLSEAIHRIRLRENNKPISVIHDELGYAVGREGGSAIAYWRKGNIPKVSDLERLTRELVSRADLDRAWLMRWLTAAGHPYPENFAQQLFVSNDAGSAISSAPVLTPADELPLQSARYELNGRDIIGRDVQRHELLTLLADAQAPVIVAIDGGGGIGKTALAFAVAQASHQRNDFDQVVWVEASAGAPHEVDALTLDRIFRLLGHYLAISEFAQLETEELVRQLRAVMRAKRVLLVVDNLETAGEPQEEIVRGLRPLLGVSRALVVSRRRFVGDVYAVHLSGLAADHFYEFLHQEARLRGLFMIEDAPAEELQQIFTATGGSPLAIKMVVGQLAFLPLPFVLECLHDVTLFADPNNRDEYTQMYNDLFLPTWSQLSPAGQQLLVGISLFVPGVGGSLEAIRAVSELSARELYTALNELWRVSLLEVAGAQRGNLHDRRYFVHTLTRNFVQLTIDADSNPALREERTRSELDFINYYIGYATANANDSAALMAELDNLTTTLRLVYDLAQPDLLLLGVLVICPQLLRQGRYTEAIIHLERAEATARNEQALQALASILLQLGVALQESGQHEAAEPRLTEALATARSIGETALQAAAEQALRPPLPIYS